ncbi:MAG: CPBP family intramembrane glutamic endopeptidase [Sedimentisphaerales bacterium]|jgi:membrane protease YdiL (CAAX protease family)
MAIVAIAKITSILEELGGQTTIADIVVCIGGILVLLVWAIRTSLGTKALDNAPIRENIMPPLWALIPFFLWFGVVSLLYFIKEKFLAGLPDWQDSIAENLAICLGVIPAIITSIMIARLTFARGLKGLGLNPKTIPRDFAAAILNLLAVMPLVLGAIILTTIIGKLIFGDKFKMPQHEELKQIIAYSQWQVRALIVFTAIVVVPFVEELIFRGMIQTALRSYIAKPWPAISLVSLVFIVFHANPEHWLALFALSLCLGYTYEKSGSLFRSIFVHALFNAMSVLAALNQ